MPAKHVVTIIILCLAVVALASIAMLRFSGEDSWICQNGTWVKHGNPTQPMPTTPCGQPNAPVNEEMPDVVLDFPKENDAIASPVTVSGKARGTWFFEASFSAKILDANGALLGQGIMQTQENWMTTEYVPFTGQISFDPPITRDGFLVLEKDNPSGLPQYDENIRIPIRFAPIETMTVKAYFNNNALDPEISCNKVFPVERTIAKTQAVARAAITELLEGPTQDEQARGYLSNINQGVTIQRLTIDDGIARVDFDEQIEFQVGGSCRVSAIRAQITETLKQFPTVQEVIISVDGRTEDILQP